MELITVRESIEDRAICAIMEMKASECCFGKSPSGTAILINDQIVVERDYPFELFFEEVESWLRTRMKKSDNTNQYFVKEEENILLCQAPMGLDYYLHRTLDLTKRTIRYQVLKRQKIEST